jgi:hypothetical protein
MVGSVRAGEMKSIEGHLQDGHTRAPSRQTTSACFGAIANDGLKQAQNRGHSSG